MLNDTVELYNSNRSVADYQIVGFLDDTKTSRLLAENLPIVVMTPEGLGTLAVSNANESYVAQFSHLCNISDAINDIKAANHLTDEQITGNTPLLSSSLYSFPYCHADLHFDDFKQSKQQCRRENRIFWYAPVSGGNQKTNNAICMFRGAVLV